MPHHWQRKEEAKKFIAEKGYDKQFGARPLRRAIQQHLENSICEMIVEQEAQPGDTIVASLEDGKVTVSKMPKKE